MQPEQKERALKVFKKIGIILLIGFAYLIFISITDWGIPCIFNLITKLQCPGCGISRMFKALAVLDFKAAFSYNAFILILLPFATVFTAQKLISYIKTGAVKYSKYETVILVILTILMIIFSILRNIPYFSFLSP